jgi:predicted dehydrogenase
MSPLRIGFVGGAIDSAVGNSHRIASQMDGCFQLVAGSFSRSRDKNLRTAREWNVGSDRAYDDVMALIDAEKSTLDAVAVLTPVFSHASIIAAILDSGLNVISEKPLVANLQECESLATVLKPNGPQLAVTFNYTGYPMVRELKSRIARGDLGVVRSMRLTMQQEGYLRKTSTGEPVRPQNWRLEDREIPTVHLDLGMHVLQMQDFLVPGNATRVWSRMDSFGSFPQVIDDADFAYYCDSGLFVHAWWGKAALGYPNGLSVEVFGEDGSARWVQANPEQLLLRGATGIESSIHRGSLGNVTAGALRYNRFKAGHPDGFLEAFANVYCDIAEVIRSDDRSSNDYVFTLDQSRRLLALLQHGSESAMRGPIVQNGKSQ